MRKTNYNESSCYELYRKPNVQRNERRGVLRTTSPFLQKMPKIIDDMLDVTLFHFDQVTGDKEFEEAPYNFNYDEEF